MGPSEGNQAYSCAKSRDVSALLDVLQPRTTRDAWLLEQEIRVTAYGTWVSYSGAARILLAIVLLAVAGGLTYTGIRLPLPVRPRRPARRPASADAVSRTRDAWL
jgi:hypothetical protein